MDRSDIVFEILKIQNMILNHAQSSNVGKAELAILTTEHLNQFLDLLKSEDKAA